MLYTNMVDTQVTINECWRSISGYINYQISNIGRVRNCVTGRILKPRLNGNGYHQVVLTNDDGKKECRIHQLDANEFIGKPNSETKLCVDHINRDRLDNQVHNLRYVTYSQNSMNTNKTTKTTRSTYKGVCFDKSCNKWKVSVKPNGKRIYLGYFDDEKQPAEVYNAKALELFGEYANLNIIED